MTYDQWKTTDPREYTQPDEEEQSEVEYLCGQVRAWRENYLSAERHVAQLRKAMKHVVNELEEDFDTVDSSDGTPQANKAMRLASELNEAMYGPGGF